MARFQRASQGLENGFAGVAECFVRNVPARNAMADTMQTGPLCQDPQIFATQLLNMGQDRAVSDNQTSTPKPNKIGHIDIIDDCLGRQPANCKTVYASSIPDVASTSSLGHSSDRLDNDQLLFMALT